MVSELVSKLSADEPIDIDANVQAFQMTLIGTALHRTAGNVSQAAKMLGIARVTLIMRMKKFKMIRESYTSSENVNV